MMTEEQDIPPPTPDIDENDGTVPHPTDDPPPPTPVTSTSGKKWTIGKTKISRGFLEFAIPSACIIILLVTALVGVFKDPTNNLWSHLLFMVAGVLTPNPKLNTTETVTPAEEEQDFISRHFTENTRHYVPYNYPVIPPNSHNYVYPPERGFVFNPNQENTTPYFETRHQYPSYGGTPAQATH